MKVLFAVHDEKVSLSIVKKYQREYKEIISYKNVYYFNAILKELQRDKSYDRVVIDEELEEFTSTSYEEKDKFIFNKLDGITDEASNAKGNDIPIILICSDRRTKSEEILVKLFGIGIYNAIIGNDRSTDEVCRLLNSPRSKKEAKLYYKIDSKDVEYDPEHENDVSEEEMQHILSYFNKLGKNEDKYAEAFKKIESQYNENQMRVIMAILPLHVRSVLEESSPEYQKLISKNGVVVNKAIRSYKKPEATSERLLNANDKKSDRPIVVPSSMDKNLVKKLSIKRPSVFAETDINDDDFDEDEDFEEDEIQNEEPINNEIENDEFKELDEDFDIKQKINALDDLNSELDDLNASNADDSEDSEDSNELEGFNDIEELDESDEIEEEKEEVVEEAPAEPKRRRGRPPKKVAEDKSEETPSEPKRKRGRPPKKLQPPEISSEDKQYGFADILPGFEEDNSEFKPINEDLLGPKFDDDKDEDVDDGFLPGIDEEDNNENDSTSVLPGFDDDETEENPIASRNQRLDDDNSARSIIDDMFDEKDDAEEEITALGTMRPEESSEIETYGQDYNDYSYDYSNYNSLLSSDRKVIAFVGTSKNGTSFIINNVAKILSESGINVAILDATQNKNSYYIYNNNDDELRETAANSIRNLIQGNASGMQVSRNLSVYVETPGQTDTNMNNVGPILENLVQNHSAVLIDCDFNTPTDYFANAQEIYLVQSMDVLTIQPLTAFLKELKNKNILEQNKIRIIINKAMRLRGVTSKQIVGGMANYNNPEMSIMTELFDRNAIEPIVVPFYPEVYASYLEGLVDCNISTNRYPKDFLATLKKLTEVIYPLLPGGRSRDKAQKGYQYSKHGYSGEYANNGFSNSVNNTLNNMKKNY